MSTPNNHLTKRRNTSTTTSRTLKQSASMPSMLLGQLRRHGDAENTATHGLPPSVVFIILRYLTFEERVFLAMCSRLALVLLPHASYFERPVDCPTDGLYVGTDGSPWKGDIDALNAAIFRATIGRHSPVHEVQLLSVQLESRHVFSLANALGGRPSLPTNLRTLRLRACGLTCDEAGSVAQAIPPSLTTLDMQDNHIGNAGAQALARMLKNNNTALQIANLEDNEIQNDGAIAISHALQKNKTMTSLNLAYNCIGARGAKAIAHSLPQSAITSINLLKNTLGEDGLAQIATSWEQSNTLKSICGIAAGATTANLAQQELGTASACIIALELRFNRALNTLNLGKISICGQYVTKAEATGTTFNVGDVVQWNDMEGTISQEEDSDGDIFVRFQQGTQAIAEALKVNRTLSSLDLCDNDLGDASETVVQAVLQHPTMEIFCNIPMKKMREDSLAELDLSSKHIGAHGAMVLADLLKVNRSLNTLDLSRNNIGGVSGFIKKDQLRGTSFKNGDTVQYNGQKCIVCMEEDSDGDLKVQNVSGVIALAEALKVNRAAKALDLHSNNLGIEGARVLCEALTHNTTLESLNVGNPDGSSSGDIKAEGARYFADMLKVNRSLNTLDLANNNIGGLSSVQKDKCHGISSFTKGDTVQYNGQQCIVREVHSDGTLEVHNISGVIALARALKFNRSLKNANLAENDIGDEGAIAISTALESNITLTDLNLQARNYGTRIVRISATGIQAIAKMLHLNRTLASVSLLYNNLGDGAAAVVAAAEQQGIIKTLCGIGPDQTTVDFSRKRDDTGKWKGPGLNAADAVLLSFDLEFNRSLTALDVRGNNLGEGITALAAAVFKNQQIEMFCEVPVKQIRNDALAGLDLKDKNIGACGAMVVAHLLHWI